VISPVEHYPSFPAYVIAPVWGVVLVPTFVSAWRIHDRYFSFLLLAIWSRYCVESFHQNTSQPIGFGVSLIALTSIATAVTGVVVVGLRSLSLRRLIPFYGVIGVIVISAIANQAWLVPASVTNPSGKYVTSFSPDPRVLWSAPNWCVTYLPLGLVNGST
jgi:hypothetical protein